MDYPDGPQVVHHCSRGNESAESSVFSYPISIALVLGDTERADVPEIRGEGNEANFYGPKKF